MNSELYLPYQTAGVRLAEQPQLEIVKLQFEKGLIVSNDLLIAGRRGGRKEGTNWIGGLEFEGDHFAIRRSIDVFDAKNGLPNYSARYERPSDELRWNELTITGADAYEYASSDQSILVKKTTFSPSADGWLAQSESAEMEYDEEFAGERMATTYEPPFSPLDPQKEMETITQQVAMIMGREYTVCLGGLAA